MKYLLLDIKHPVKNIDCALNILKAAIAESIHLDRTLVVGTFTIATDDNLGHALENISYDRYVNLNKTRICSIANGDITQVTEPFRYIKAEDFDLKAYSDNAVLSTESDKPVTAELNSRYKVIVRKILTGKYNYNDPDILVRFAASAAVDNLSDTVLKAMGTNLETVKKCAKIHYGVDYAANPDFHKVRTPQHPAYYACLCVRYDNPTTNSQKLYATDDQQIKETLKHIRIAKDRAIYVISDIDKPDCIASLRNYYTFYRYCDFPELKTLISGEKENKIDTAMLYSVEKNILKYAAIKIIPFEDLSDFPIIYSDSSHTVPWRYRHKSILGFHRIYRHLLRRMMSRLARYKSLLGFHRVCRHLLRRVMPRLARYKSLLNFRR